MKGIAIIAGAICLEKAEKAEEERKKKNKITSSALIICQKRSDLRVSKRRGKDRFQGRVCGKGGWCPTAQPSTP